MPNDSSQIRLMDLLDQTYALTEDDSQLEQVFDSANRYFFDSEDGWTLAADFNHSPALDPQIERHTDRIMRLLDRFSDVQDTHDSLTQSLRETAYAKIVIAPTGKVSSANDAAQALFGQITGQPLPLDKSSTDTLEKALRAMATQSPLEQDLIPLTREDDGTTLFALAHIALPDGKSPQLALALSYIDWTEDRLLEIGTVLGLTPRETAVFAGHIRGQSQPVIAQTMQKSVDTIKAQSKSILQKTGQSRMSDLVVLANSVAYLKTDTPEIQTPDLSDGTKILNLSDGRRVQYRVHGPKNGTAFLFVHGYSIGPFFPQTLHDGFMDRNFRIIAPSRPWFGDTTAPNDKTKFDATSISDALAVLNAEKITQCAVIAQQGGVSHAYRIAAALGDNATGMLMLGAGIPINSDSHFSGMNTKSRFAAIAMRKAPKVLQMVMRTTLNHYLRKGYRHFLEQFFRDDPIDLESLRNSKIYPAIESGLVHLSQQGVNAMFYDGQAAMADWRADYDRVNVPAEWLHGAHCPVLSAKFVDEFVRRTSNYPVHIIPDTGYHMMYERPNLVLDAMERAAENSNRPT